MQRIDWSQYHCIHYIIPCSVNVPVNCRKLKRPLFPPNSPLFDMRPAWYHMLRCGPAEKREKILPSLLSKDAMIFNSICISLNSFTYLFLWCSFTFSIDILLAFMSLPFFPLSVSIVVHFMLFRTVFSGH